MNVNCESRGPGRDVEREGGRIGGAAAGQRSGHNAEVCHGIMELFGVSE